MDSVMSIEKRDEKRNVKVSLDRETIRKAEILAARRSTSLSELVAHRIEIIFGVEESYESAELRALELFGRGFHLGGGVGVGRDELRGRAR
jgi:hypothetical protein